MRRAPFVWEPGEDILTANGGLGVVGMLFNATDLNERLGASDVPGVGIPFISHRDVIASYVGLLSQGKSDFDHIEAFRDDEFFRVALALKCVPSSPTLRQRLEQAASDPKGQWSAALRNSAEHLLLQHARCKPLRVGEKEYVPVDMDVSPFDNSKTKKEGVSRTYKGHDGFSPMFGYLGNEGYTLRVELREGKQHCQKNTPEFLSDCLRRAKRILPEAQLLVRMDSGNDATENIDRCEENKVDYLIKRNLRQESLAGWLERAKREGEVETLRDGKKVYRGVCYLAPRQGHALVRVVYEVTERTVTAKGERLLLPEVEVDSYWTSLPDEPTVVVRCYRDHGTMEQFHSEYKTDMDLERLPSGKFATNQLILDIAVLTYNILRIIGQTTIGDASVPLRKKAQRRRIRTVIQNLILCAAKLVRHARSLRVRYAWHNPWGVVLGHLYATFG